MLLALKKYTKYFFLNLQDFEDAADEEVKQFTPSPRITDADKANDRRSVNRKLDQKLHLVVKQKLGGTEPWLFPMALHQEGQTMREAAEAALLMRCGDKIHAPVFGNAPIGFYKYKFPKNVDMPNGSIGAKLFFYKAQFQNGEISKGQSVCDYLWLTSAEMQQLFVGKYFQAVSKFILE